MKSSWAYNNGKREMKSINESLKVPLRGWVITGKTKSKTFYAYAERSKYDETQLVVKTYANKSQADKMRGKINAEGIKCWFKLNYPWVIQTTDINSWGDNAL